MKRKLALLFAASLTIMAGTTIAPSLPLISVHFSDVPQAELLSKLVLTLPSLFIAVLGLFAGILVNKVGRLKVLLVSLVLYTAAGVSGYFLDDLYAILVGRAFLGVAVAGIMTSVSTLVGDYFAGDERNKFMGLQSMFMALGGVAFVVIGGILASTSWRLPFLIYISALAVMVLCALALKEPQIVEDSEEDNRNQGFSNMGVAVVMIATFVAMVIFFMVPVQVPFLLKEINVDSTSMIGLAIGSFTFGGAITSGLYGKIKQKLSHSRIYVLAFVIFSLGYFTISYLHNYNLVVLCLFLSGIGGGFLLPNGTLWLLAIVPVKQRGVMMGMLTTVIFLGQFLSPVLIQPIINAGGVAMGFSTTGILAFVMGLSFVFVGNINKIRSIDPALRSPSLKQS